MSKKDGGPAFPNIASDERVGVYVGDKGMSLRDYFAAHAPDCLMNGDLALPDICMLLGVSEKEYDWKFHWPKAVAEIRYRYADAMIARMEGGK